MVTLMLDTFPVFLDTESQNQILGPLSQFGFGSIWK
jgi:hypothetical protein